MKLLYPLLFLCLGVFGQNDKMPKFSWDKVPVMIHTGDRDGLSKKDVAFIAKHSDFVCLEKNHGFSHYGSVEKGIEVDAKKLKAINPELKCLYYWNTFLDYSFAKAHDEYLAHPEWWLTKLDGELDKKHDRLMRYDLSNLEVREWWTDQAKEAVVNGACDGLFMDAFPQVLSPGNKRLWGEEKYDAILLGLEQIMTLTREKLGDDNILIYNGIRNNANIDMGGEHLEWADAAMVEHLAAFGSKDKVYIAKDIEDISRAGKAGKIIVVKGWPSFTWLDKEIAKESYKDLHQRAQDDITFPLACYLIAAQEYCYFCYSWGYTKPTGALSWYDEFDKPLGQPKGDFRKEGWIYTREFEHCKVWVDLESREATIDYEM